jgi:hypothetical protein
MKDQLNLLQGIKNKNNGIEKALENANKNNENWSKNAYSFLLHYLKNQKTFMAEDVRIASFGVVSIPPSNRAWGAIFVMAKKNQLIRSIGFAKVKNPKAHGTPANLWAVNSTIL